MSTSVKTLPAVGEQITVTLTGTLNAYNDDYWATIDITVDGTNLHVQVPRSAISTPTVTALAPCKECGKPCGLIPATPKGSPWPLWEQITPGGFIVGVWIHTDLDPSDHKALPDPSDFYWYAERRLGFDLASLT